MTKCLFGAQPFTYLHLTITASCVSTPRLDGEPTNDAGVIVPLSVTSANGGLLVRTGSGTGLDSLQSRRSRVVSFSVIHSDVVPVADTCAHFVKIVVTDRLLHRKYLTGCGRSAEFGAPVIGLMAMIRGS